MSRSVKVGKIKAIARARERTTPSRRTEPEKEVDVRQELLKPYNLDADNYRELTNLEFSDLLYCLEIYKVEQTLKSLEVKKERKEGVLEEKGPNFPFNKLLETKRNEYEYLVNFNPKASIGLVNCRIGNCLAKESVSFLSSVCYRGDEACKILFRCNVCGQIQ